MKVNGSTSQVRRMLDFVMLSGVFHFSWEILQAPLYSSFYGVSHFAGILECAAATLGDVLIMVGALVIARAMAGPKWNKQTIARGTYVFIAVGLLATIALEFINTEILARWTYGPDMPRVPILGTGLMPIAQWVVIPLVVLWYLRRLHPPFPVER